MTGWPVPSADRRVSGFRARIAVPGSAVNVITNWWDNKPRIEAVSRDGNGNPYCLISDDARDIWRELRAH